MGIIPSETHNNIPNTQSGSTIVCHSLFAKIFIVLIEKKSGSSQNYFLGNKITFNNQWKESYMQVEENKRTNRNNSKLVLN